MYIHSFFQLPILHFLLLWHLLVISIMSWSWTINTLWDRAATRRHTSLTMGRYWAWHTWTHLILRVRIGILNVSISQITQWRLPDTSNVPKITQLVNSLGFQFRLSESRMCILTQHSSHCYAMLCCDQIWFPFTDIITPIGVIRAFPQRNTYKHKELMFVFQIDCLTGYMNA